MSITITIPSDPAEALRMHLKSIDALDATIKAEPSGSDLTKLYDERTCHVYFAMFIAVAAGYTAGIRFDARDGPDWPVVSIDLPNVGQVAWHVKAVNQAWDGHTDAQKHDRIMAFVAAAPTKAAE